MGFEKRAQLIEQRRAGGAGEFVVVGVARSIAEARGACAEAGLVRRRLFWGYLCSEKSDNFEKGREAWGEPDLQKFLKRPFYTFRSVPFLDQKKN